MDSYKSDKSTPSSPQGELDDLKIEAIEKIMQIKQEDLLYQIAEYLKEEHLTDENLSTSMVKEPTSPYLSAFKPGKLKLQIIRRILNIQNAYISEFLRYLDQIITQEGVLPAIDEALEDIKKGRLYTAETVADMFKQILGK